jgi:hypothetical protein
VRECAHAPGLALLVAPPGRIAGATLVLIDGRGRQRRIALPGITAGLVPPGRSGIARERTPGLAVRGGDAFIASATDARVVEVDLASARLRSYTLSDAQAAKGVEDTERKEIGFVGPHMLAVAGVDITTTPNGAERERATGLRLVDTRTWKVRLAEPDASVFTPLPEGGLALWPISHPARGLVLLNSDGRRRTTVLRRQALVQVQYAGHYAYAVATRPRHRTWVIDLRTRHVIHSLPTAQPGVVLGSE